MGPSRLLSLAAALTLVLGSAVAQTRSPATPRTASPPADARTPQTPASDPQAKRVPAGPGKRAATREKPATGAQDSMAGGVERGRYLVERVAMCVECHSGRDQAGNIIPEERFEGGPVPVAPPWRHDWAIRAPRIAGLPGYDEALGIRLLTEGAIDRGGRQLRPPMPRFRMTREDAAAVVAFLKSIG